jgi:hypothetical protein
VDKFAIEFLIIPPHCPAGIVHVGKETPPFVDRLKLKAIPIGNRYSVWTDFGEGVERFVRIVRECVEKSPTVLGMIEMCDTNRFETRTEGNFVARFEFRICGNIERLITNELIDFCVNMADEYCLVRLPGEIQHRNQSIRDVLLKEDEEKKKTGQKKAEEEEKAQKKRERRDQKRLTPKVKVIRE